MPADLSERIAPVDDIANRNIAASFYIQIHVQHHLSWANLIDALIAMRGTSAEDGVPSGKGPTGKPTWEVDVMTWWGSLAARVEFWNAFDYRDA